MRIGIGGTIALVAASLSGAALAQGDVIAERRAGLRGVGQHMEAIQGVVRSGGDTRPLVERVDQMTAFFRGFPDRFPTESLTPPAAQGTGDGQTRALAAIAGDRAAFVAARDGTLTALDGLRTAAASGDAAATGRALQATGGACANCHRSFRAR